MHTPVDELGHPDLVLGWARDAVDPTELAEVAARLPVNAEYLAVERHFVDAARYRSPMKSTGLGPGVMHRASGAPGAREPLVEFGVSRP